MTVFRSKAGHRKCKTDNNIKGVPGHRRTHSETVCFPKFPKFDTSFYSVETLNQSYKHFNCDFKNYTFVLYKKPVYKKPSNAEKLRN